MLLIIFGAGASFDHDLSALQVSNYPRVPLTNDLINKDLVYVQQALTKWPGAVALVNRLNDLKETMGRSFNLEAALYAEQQRNVASVNAQLLSFKFYIHDIIRNNEIQVRSVNQGNSNYTLLLNLLQENKIDERMGICLVTFNYDTLIETACTQLYPYWDFFEFEDYITGSQVVKLYKPHGSISWRNGYSITHQPGRNNKIKVLSNPKNYNLQLTSQQIYDCNYDYSPMASNSFVDEPILALPYKEKTTFVFPENHKQSLKDNIKEVTHILTIGWRGTEQHFYDEIMSGIPETSRLKILNVNKGGVEIEENFNRYLGGKISNMSNYANGFAAFMRDPQELKSFIGS